MFPEVEPLRVNKILQGMYYEFEIVIIPAKKKPKKSYKCVWCTCGERKEEGGGGGEKGINLVIEVSGLLKRCCAFTK